MNLLKPRRSQVKPCTASTRHNSQNGLFCIANSGIDTCLPPPGPGVCVRIQSEFPPKDKKPQKSALKTSCMEASTQEADSQSADFVRSVPQEHCAVCLCEHDNDKTTSRLQTPAREQFLIFVSKFFYLFFHNRLKDSAEVCSAKFFHRGLFVAHISPESSNLEGHETRPIESRVVLSLDAFS